LTEVELQDVVPELSASKKEATGTLAAYSNSSWKDWCPEWLSPGLYVANKETGRALDVAHEPEAASLDFANAARGDRKQAILKEYEDAVEDIKVQINGKSISGAEGTRKWAELEAHKNAQLEKLADFSQWEAGNGGGPEESRKGRKGKGNAPEREKERSPEKKKEKEVVEYMPVGWVPAEGAQVSV
jgi:hypothetical protein